jgi:hypothetical protein
MERVPSQVDLVRLCDAADSIVDYYRGRFGQGYGTVEDFRCELMLFYSVLRFLPYPKHFEGLPFDVGMWSTKPLWQGWTDEAYEMCMGVVVNARILGDDPTVGEFENRVNHVKHFADLLREKLKSPWPFGLIPDAESCSLYREGAEYSHCVARLKDWFSVVAAICNADGFLNHEVAEREFKAAGFKGDYDPSFRIGLSRFVNPNLLPLGVEISAVKGKGWQISSFCGTLP